MSYTVVLVHIDEHFVPGKRLGRHIRQDSRRGRYLHRRSGAPVQSRLLSRHIPILNQADVGSCTGNAETGALGTDPLWSTLNPAVQSGLDEQLALNLYSAAETLDGDGPYPPNDNGSSGPSVCQAAKNAGLIGGYTHCLALADVLDAIGSAQNSGRVVILGTNWYDSFDAPDSSGNVSISPGAFVRGGHEYLCRGVDTDAKTVYCDNSWGTGYGVGGSFTYSWATLDRLLNENGDGCVSLPVGGTS